MSVLENCLSDVPVINIQKSIAGAKGGNRSLELGVGVHGRNYHKIRKDAGKAGMAAAYDRGQLPWDEAEKLFLRMITRYADFWYGKKLAAKKIARKINDEFYAGKTIRTSVSVSRKLYSEKRNLGLERW